MVEMSEPLWRFLTLSRTVTIYTITIRTVMVNRYGGSGYSSNRYGRNVRTVMVEGEASRISPHVALPAAL